MNRLNYHRVYSPSLQSIVDPVILTAKSASVEIAQGIKKMINDKKMTLSQGAEVAGMVEKALTRAAIDSDGVQGN